MMRSRTPTPLWTAGCPDLGQGDVEAGQTGQGARALLRHYDAHKHAPNAWHDGGPEVRATPRQF